MAVKVEDLKKPDRNPYEEDASSAQKVRMHGLGLEDADFIGELGTLQAESIIEQLIVIKSAEEKKKKEKEEKEKPKKKAVESYSKSVHSFFNWFFILLIINGLAFYFSQLTPIDVYDDVMYYFYGPPNSRYLAIENPYVIAAYSTNILLLWHWTVAILKKIQILWME